MDLLRDLNVILGTVLGLPQPAEPTAGPGQSRAAVTFVCALEGLDLRLSALTGHMLNLRVLVPVGLAGLGVWQILKKGLMLDTVPGCLLVWLACDAFVKLHPQGVSPAATAAKVQAAG